MGSLLTFGDSWPTVDPTSQSFAWPQISANAFGLLWMNFATPGHMVPDAANVIYTLNPSAGDVSCLEIGNNDEGYYGADATKQALYRTGLDAMAAWLALPSKQYAKVSGSFTGAWADTGVYNLGKYSASVGATCSFTASGTVIYVGVIQQVGIYATYSVWIDGVSQGIFSANADGLTTNNGIGYGPKLHRFPGLSAGAHTVMVKVETIPNPAGDKVYVDWCAGNAQSSFNELWLMNLSRYTATGYANSLGGHGSDANVLAYNAEIAACAAALTSDGLNVRVCDFYSVTNLATDMNAGGAHWNNRGHARGACKFISTRP